MKEKKMKRYFNTEDYFLLEGESLDAVNRWLTDNNVSDQPVTLIEETDDGTQVILSGPMVAEDNSLMNHENEIKAILTNNFPWENIEKTFITKLQN